MDAHSKGTEQTEKEIQAGSRILQVHLKQGSLVNQRLCVPSDEQCFLPAALRAAQICQYLVYSEADFEVFRPAGATRCIDGGEIWHAHSKGMAIRGHPCQISPPSVQRQGCRTPKIEIFTQI